MTSLPVPLDTEKLLSGEYDPSMKLSYGIAAISPDVVLVPTGSSESFKIRFLDKENPFTGPIEMLFPKDSLDKVAYHLLKSDSVVLMPDPDKPVNLLDFAREQAKILLEQLTINGHPIKIGTIGE